MLRLFPVSLAVLAALTLTSAASVCNPSVTVLGSPCVNSAVTIVMGGHPDCLGCLVGSTEAGPTQVGPKSIPVGTPADSFVVGFGGDQLTMTIPNDPSLVGQVWHFAAVLTDGHTVNVSMPYQITICP